MKRILINATHNEEVRVALCKGNHLYDFDLENRTREQKKANIYKGHVTRVEPSLEAVFVEYGSKRQGFLPVREIASEYLSGNPREENIRKLIKEGDELIVQVEKEERGNKGAALSTYVSLAGRYLVLMPNNPKGGGISRQISGKLREDMKRMLGNLDLPKGMSVIVRTAGIGKTQEDLQHDLNHLLNIWNAIQDQNKKYASPRLVHQEAGVVTRAVRDYLRDDISEIWIDNEEAFIEAETFIKAVMPTQIEKLRKYTEFEPMFSSFNVERQIETAYQREVRLPSGGSIVIDQTEALVAIDINSAKSTKGADVSETAYNTNLEAADEIARQLRLRDMGGLIVIDFIDMNENKHQKEVEKRLVEATKYDRARVQFGDISRFGLMEMSRQRLRPSLEESTGYICPRCHGNGMIRDLRSLSLSIMRQIEQTALKERHGEVQAEVPTDVAAFLLNEKRESLVYLEQDSGTRITILPHAHLESPNFNLHFNHHGFAPASYERVTDTQQQENSSLGYEVDWQTAESERPEQQPTRQPRQPNDDNTHNSQNAKSSRNSDKGSNSQLNKPSNNQSNNHSNKQSSTAQNLNNANQQANERAQQAQLDQAKPAAVAWLSNLFAPTPQAQMSATVSSADAAQAIEAIVNTGAQSRGAFGQLDSASVAPQPTAQVPVTEEKTHQDQRTSENKQQKESDKDNDKDQEKDRRRSRNNRNRNKYDKRSKSDNRRRQQDKDDKKTTSNDDKSQDQASSSKQDSNVKDLPKREPNSKRDSRGPIERGERKQPQHKSNDKAQDNHAQHEDKTKGTDKNDARSQNQQKVDPNEVNLRVSEAEPTQKKSEVVHISLDDNTENNTSNESKTTAASDKGSQRNKSQLKSEPKPDSKSETKSEAKTETKAESKDKPQSQQPPVVKVDPAAADGPATEGKSNSVQNQAKQDNSETGSKPTESVQAETEAQKNKAVDNKPDTESTSDTNAKSDSTSLGFDTSALFADRYVAAKKYGQASNDPRLIKAALKQQNEQAKAEEIQPIPAVAIAGTVGQFIHTHLAQPSMRLAKDGVITCFLAALSAHKETSGGTSKGSAKRKPAKSVQTFSFVNYGYQSLSPSYLERFAKMTSAVATHNIEQGKTEVAPAPVAARASNDPRGQHPDYTPADSVSEPATADNAEPSVMDSDGHLSDSSTVSKTDLLKQSVGGVINQVLGQQGLDMINAGQTEAAFLKALNTSSEPHLSEEQKVAESLEQPATALVNEPEADEVSNESSEMLDESKSAAEVQSSEEVQENNTANKTSIESYKSMIENISEQLLPQTGLLNLTSPKVPKARSRKVKDESKKQDDAHNEQTDEGDNDS